MFSSIVELSHFQPIQTGDKIEQIITTLRKLIIDGTLEPGSELPSEREFAQQLNVSRYSLREALRVAQTQGLIELSQGKRPRVKPPSSDALTEIFGITIQRSNIRLFDLIIARISLECDIVSMVAKDAGADLIKELEEITQTMESHRDDLELCAKKDLEFHDALVRRSHNTVFKIMLDSVAYHLSASRRATLRLTGVDRALKGHKNIINALKQKDQEKARAAMLGHLEMAEDDIMVIEKMG
jgi:GntR family transcriptional repressor for pyruvate dehydrogenase complex